MSNLVLDAGIEFFKCQYTSRPFKMEIHEQGISLFTPFIQIKEILSSHMHMCILISYIHEYHNPYYFYSVSLQRVTCSCASIIAIVKEIQSTFIG